MTDDICDEWPGCNLSWDEQIKSIFFIQDRNWSWIYHRENFCWTPPYTQACSWHHEENSKMLRILPVEDPVSVQDRYYCRILAYLGLSTSYLYLNKFLTHFWKCLRMGKMSKKFFERNSSQKVPKNIFATEKFLFAFGFMGFNSIIYTQGPS